MIAILLAILVAVAAPRRVVRAVGYVRVSTEDQTAGFRPEIQRTRITAYCEARGWVLVAIYEDASTGRETTRKQYAKMMEDHDDWDVIVTLKTDRVHRSQKNAIAFIDQLGKWDKAF